MSTPCTITWHQSSPVENFHEDGKTYNTIHQVAAVGLASNCHEELAVEIGHALATASGTYGLCWYMDSDGSIKCSLHSVGNFDVSVIAYKFGGRSKSKNEAEFTCTLDTLNKFFAKDERTL